MIKEIITQEELNRLLVVEEEDAITIIDGGLGLDHSITVYGTLKIEVPMQLKGKIVARGSSHVEAWDSSSIGRAHTLQMMDMC